MSLPSSTMESLTGNYFISNYPPFSCWQESEIDSWLDLLHQRPETPANLLLYVHIPFCVERCQYCYYLSYDDRPREMERYVHALLKETRAYAATPALSGRVFLAVYFGGGTPSLLPITTLRTILQEMQRCISWDRAREITFECAPKSVTPAKLRLLRDAGITRISMGVQQMDDFVLQRNGRTHLTADIERAYENIRSTGFDIVNIDLMVGLMGETDRSFLTSLQRTISMVPESITIYQMEIPFNTPLFHALRNGTIAESPAVWEVKRQRLNRGIDMLEAAGYTMRSAYTAVQSSISSAFVYQDEQYRGADLLGIGASSFSYIAGMNMQNLTALRPYLERVEGGKLPLSRARRLTPEEQLVREFVLQVKLGSVDREYFRNKFQVDPCERFRKSLALMERSGLVSISDHNIRLTRQGLLRADHLLLDFYLPEHRDLRYS